MKKVGLSCILVMILSVCHGQTLESLRMSYSNEVVKIESKKAEAMKVALSDYHIGLVKVRAVCPKSDTEKLKKVDNEIEMVASLLKEYSPEDKKAVADVEKVKVKEDVAKKTSIPSNAKEYNGHHYLVVENPITWSKATLNAKEMGGYLARIKDNDEMIFVVSLIRTAGYVWVGAEYKSMQWKWLDGTSVDSSLCEKNIKKRNTSNMVLCVSTKGYLTEGKRDSSGWYVIEWDE